MAGIIQYLTRIEYTWRYIDWLIIYGITSHSRIFHLYGDVTIACNWLQNLGLCSALRAFEQSCHTCCDTGPRFFRSHQKDRPILSPLTTREGMWRIYSNPGLHGWRGDRDDSTLVYMIKNLSFVSLSFYWPYDLGILSLWIEIHQLCIVKN
jgi:hypothetical protein